MDSKQTVEGFDQEPDLFVFCSFVDPDSGSSWILVSRILTQAVKNDLPKRLKVETVPVSYKVRTSIYVLYGTGMYSVRYRYHLLLKKRCKFLSLGFRSVTAVLVCV